MHLFVWCLNQVSSVGIELARWRCHKTIGSQICGPRSEVLRLQAPEQKHTARCCWLNALSPQAVSQWVSGSFSFRIGSGLEMGQQGQRWPVWILLLGLSVCVSGITRQELFPFGRSAGDQSLHEGNDETQEITLKKPVIFYNGQFFKIYVSVWAMNDRLQC